MKSYIYVEGEEIGVEGESTIRQEQFNLGYKDYKVIVTKDKEYYNFYILDDSFKREPLNNIQLQEEIGYWYKLPEKEKMRFIEEMVVSFYLWHKYNRDYTINSDAK